jgi:Tfp pilus assembly protein PilP
VKRMFLVVSAVLLLAPASPNAQIKVGARVGEPPTSAGAYESLGRRDPFVSLISTKRTPSPTTHRGGTGLASFYVADVVVRGIVRKGDEMMAILENPDKQSYVAKVKDRLSDAVIKSIDADGVVFVEIPDAGTNARPREIRKLLRAVDEVNR